MWEFSTKKVCAKQQKIFEILWGINLLSLRCVVRAAATSKTGKNEYFHIGTDGEFIEGGPYEYPQICFALYLFSSYVISFIK